MLIATILLIANLAALVLNGNPFMAWRWNIFAYIIEIGFYVICFLIFIIIAAIMGSESK